MRLTADDPLANGINAVHLKYRLGDVETDCRNHLHALAPLNRGCISLIKHLREVGSIAHQPASRDIITLRISRRNSVARGAPETIQTSDLCLRLTQALFILTYFCAPREQFADQR